MATFDPVYLTMNEKPAAILSGMDEILNRREFYSADLPEKNSLAFVAFPGWFSFCLDRPVFYFHWL